MTATWQPPLDLFASTAERVALNSRCWAEHQLGWTRTGPSPAADPDCDAFSMLMESLQWRRAERTMYDRLVEVPRLMSWHHLGDAGTPSILRHWAQRIDAEYGTTMTSAGLNLYRDGRDSVAWHGDLVRANRTDSTVAIVSLGATRPLLVRPTTGGTSRKWMLGSGDLFVMGGRSQHDFQHSIPKMADSGPRISVVFRETAVEAEPEYALPFDIAST